ncbi:aminoacyl-tRNA hydrolase [Anaplasma bovis]|uniref:aminoacyl-tRNA hydrolase n=1 Tax=Anaplasma bovis TaxID=186733 RepID=UPI002FEF2652
MFLFVGLGNPGKKYESTRHNVGFMAVDAIARDFGFPTFSQKHLYMVSVGKIDQHKLVLIKPCTYMNNSGVAVLSAVGTYKIALDSLVVFHDDVALLLGAVKVKKGGGSAGHNGIRSIDSSVGSEYWRIRVGIGPQNPEGRDLSSFVLSNFDNIEEMQNILDNISANVHSLLNGDPRQLGQKVSEPKKCT